MSNKITFRFVLYFLAFYMTIVLASSGILIYFIFKLNEDFNAYSHVQDLEIATIQGHIEKDEKGTFTISEPIRKFAWESGGILQIINEDGEVIQSSSSELPTKYEFTDFIRMANEQNSYIWLLEDGNSLLFTAQTDSDLLMRKMMESTDFPFISDEQKVFLKQQDAIFERYDKDGNILYTTQDKDHKSMNGMQLLELSQDPTEQKEMKTATILEDGTTAVIRMPNPYYAPFDSSMFKFLKNFLIGFVIFHAALFLFIIGFSFWIGQRFGRPVFYFMKKIEKLSRKDYGYLEDRKIRNVKSGRLKTKYRLYEDVDKSLMKLAKNLEENERKIQMTEQLREDWITGLSHDLKTPLSSIYGYSAMLESSHDWTIEEIQKFASVMQEKASYMDALINDLTYTYQLKNNGVLIEKEKIELGGYIQQYASQYEGDTVNFSEIGTPIYVTIDPKRFSRVLDNIIGNAIKHNPDHTPIHVAIRLEDNLVLLEVLDEGVGLSPDMMENLFDRYYRGTNTTSGDNGTGLGLTIAKQLVEAHGGNISVDSNKQGTKIAIGLPLVEDIKKSELNSD